MTGHPTTTTGLASIYVHPADQQKFDTFKRLLLADLQPRTFFEGLHFDSILHASWNIQRSIELEGNMQREAAIIARPDASADAELCRKLDRVYRDKKMHQATRRQSAAELRRLQQTDPPLPPAPSANEPETIAVPDAHQTIKIGRNDLCRCGSGIKFKRCCLIASHSPLREVAAENLQYAETNLSEAGQIKIDDALPCNERCRQQGSNTEFRNMQKRPNQHLGNLE